MSTDGAVRPPQGRNSDELKQKPPPRQPTVYFPLGYKQAAYQWVSWRAYSCI